MYQYFEIFILLHICGHQSNVYNISKMAHIQYFIY